MSSTIIIGANKKQKDEEIKKLLDNYDLDLDENNPDVLKIDPEENKKSIGISQTKKISKFINEKPYSHKLKVVIIDRGEMLTNQAQNSLLKDLEEHPQYVHIILGVKTEKDVLETVLSRCKRINLRVGEQDKKDSKDSVSVQEFINMGVGERLSLTSKLSKLDKENIIEILEEWVHQAKANISEIGAEKIEHILRVKKDLETTNINTKLALEHLSVNL